MTSRRYTISEMSETSNISKKALRFYDKLGLISPRLRGSNNYRYYTHEDVLSVPPLKYYKQMGFRLEEIRAAFDADSTASLNALCSMFVSKMQDLRQEEEVLRLRAESIHDWLELLHEAEMLLDNDTRQVSVKYISPQHLLCHDEVFLLDIKSTIINMEFTNFVESLGNNISGPVIVHYSSVADRLANVQQPIQVLQRPMRPCKPEHLRVFGGTLMASCYHIGPHETINETYRNLQTWCTANNFVYAPDSFERYVTDYWTTNNKSLFVTEVLVQVYRQDSGFNPLP